MPRHSDTKFLPYSAAEIYSLVADVESYPKFLPWNAAARIRTRKPLSAEAPLTGLPEGKAAVDRTDAEVMEADLVISFKVFRERFGSRVVLLPAESMILTEYLDGPFRYMQSRWEMTDRAGGGCEVKFFVDFEFRNAILQGVIGLVFNEAMQRIVRAFERRAVELYGSRA